VSANWVKTNTLPLCLCLCCGLTVGSVNVIVANGAVY
jgi:hypothetical protein